MQNVWASGLCIVLLATAAFYDTRSRRIPNWIIVSGMLLGLTASSVTNDGIGLYAATVGLFVGLFAFIPLYALKVLGAGDVKLIAMVGSFLGVANLLGAMIASSLAGGLLAIGFAVRAGQLGHVLGNIRMTFLGMLMRVPIPIASTTAATPAPARRIPYGIAIAAGTTLYLLWRNLPGVLS